MYRFSVSLNLIPGVISEPRVSGILRGGSKPDGNYPVQGCYLVNRITSQNLGPIWWNMKLDPKNPKILTLNTYTWNTTFEKITNIWSQTSLVALREVGSKKPRNTLKIKFIDITNLWINPYLKFSFSFPSSPFETAPPEVADPGDGAKLYYASKICFHWFE